MTKLLIISLMFIRLTATVLAGFINGPLKMTRRLRMSISQKLASWKGSAEDDKAGKNIIGVNQRNPRLINDLRSTKDYVRKNNLFMQNKANFQKVKFNVSPVNTKDYDQLDTWSIGKNKANSKPIQSQFKPNSKPIQTQYKPKQTQFKPKKNPISPPESLHVLGRDPEFTQFHINELRTMNNELITNKPYFKRYLAKMAHHGLKYVDRLAQLALNLKKSERICTHYEKILGKCCSI